MQPDGAKSSLWLSRTLRRHWRAECDSSVIHPFSRERSDLGTSTVRRRRGNAWSQATGVTLLELRCPRNQSPSRWVACSSSGSQIARHLPGHHSWVAASPLRCQTGLSWCAVPREGRHLVSSGGLLPAFTCWTHDRLWGVPSRGIGDRGLFSSVVQSQVLFRSRCDTCRTIRETGSVGTRFVRLAFLAITERHWQRLGSHRKYVPWSQHTRGSLRHVSSMTKI